MKRSSLTPLVLGLCAAVFGCSNSASSSGDNGGASNPSGGHPGAAGAGHGAGNTGVGGAASVAGAGNGAGAGNSAGAGNGAGAGNVGGASPAGGTGAGGSSAAGGNPGGAGAPPAAGAGGGLGAYTGVDFGAPSDGGTVTYQNIGKAGSYQSVCEPPTKDACCQKPLAIDGDKLTPWDKDLIATLRGPIDFRQFAVYQPTTEGQPSDWKQVASWDVRTPTASKGIAFSGDAVKGSPFKGIVGSTCLVNASTDKAFGCGPGSSPYCKPDSGNKNFGWAGSKMFVFLASMPHVGNGGITTAQNCGAVTNGWHDAPWIGLSVGELIRAGAFSACQCYGGNAGSGCGQINALEVINDNDTSGNYKNLEIFSSNFFSYGGDFGGPCGTKNCNTTNIPGTVDLVTGSMAAPAGVLGSQTPLKNPNGFLRRPTTGFRYFVLLLDVSSRTVQYAVIHPQKVPAGLGALLPNLPFSLPQTTIDSVINLRLPH